MSLFCPNIIFILIVINFSSILAQSHNNQSAIINSNDLIVKSKCKESFNRYRKCSVPQYRSRNCSLQEAISKLGTVLRGIHFDFNFKVPAYTTISQQIEKAGYNSSEHHLINEGYVLSAFRLIKDNYSPSNCSKPPIILQHGAQTNCASWTYPSTDEGIVWRLVEAGFDVWLPCTRGTMYSAYHVTLTKEKSQYWDFDIDDMGNDAGKWVDYILEVTQCKKLTYIGHSMGSTSMFSLLSLQPQYNQKIAHYFAISATVFQSYPTFFIAPLASFECVNLLVSNYLLPKLTSYDLNGPFPGKLGAKMFRKYMPYICSASEAQSFICGVASFAIFGCEFANTDYTMLANSLPFLMDKIPLKAYRHGAQHMAMKDFCRFDYGPIKNMKYYSSCLPPCYDLSKITANATIFELSSDADVGHEDLVRLMKSLKNVENKELVPLPGERNHVDCLVGNNPKLYVDTILRRLGL